VADNRWTLSVAGGYNRRAHLVQEATVSVADEHVPERERERERERESVESAVDGISKAVVLLQF
jgi:hypothetical protein